MKAKRIFAMLLACTLSFGALAACDSEESYTAKNDKYVIGVSGPLTGDASVYGLAVQNGAQLAVDEINANGGLNGVKFQLVVKDDQRDPDLVEDIYTALHTGGMQVSLGCVTTGPALKFKELAAKDQVFFLTPSATGDEVVSESNGYQMCFADGNQGQVAAAFVNDYMAGQTIGVLYKSDENYSKGIYEQFKANLDESVTVVETSFTDVTATNFSAQIEQLKDCKFIFMPIYYAPASVFMTQAKDILDPKAVYYGCDGFDGLDRLDNFDLNTIPQKVTMLSHFNSKATIGKSAEFIAKYTEKYGRETVNQFSASAYDCVYAIYGAMKAAVEAGKKIPVDITASELCKILKEQFDGGYVYTNGITGDAISWDESGFVNKSAIQYAIKECTTPETE